MKQFFLILKQSGYPMDLTMPENGKIITVAGHAIEAIMSNREFGSELLMMSGHSIFCVESPEKIREQIAHSLASEGDL